ncbi:polysaccharide biosynthesis protein [Halococcus morrhuae DSM 1307]|uniref:Polysaccharide biosynthesis protein n=1 Tax=Halococcus morrhuae DSM 1307 TaxID=931277 RepID=M0MAE8_HALMO|nr:flippase [Halococcus morrhuae]EMA41370.1 polysaccharide biosynthesis protein [Halococcus morrhuae DSM 1307]
MSSIADSLGGLVKSAGIVLAGTVMANVLGILAEIFIPRALDPAVYGRLGLAYGIVSAVSSLAILGIPNGVTRFLSEKESAHEETDVLQSGYAISLVGTVIAAAAIYLARFEIAALMDDPEVAPLLVVFVPYLLAFPIVKVSVGVLRAEERTTAATLAQRIGPRVFGLALVAALIAAGRPVVGAIGYWLSFSVVGALLALYAVRQHIDVGSLVARLPSHDTVRELWSFSWPLAAGTSLTIMLANVDIVMIGYFLDSASVGYYRSIQPLKQVIFFFSGSFAFLFMPLATKHYSQGDFAGLDALYTVTTKWIVALTFPAVLLFTLFSPDAIRLFFGTAYLPAAPALSVLIAGLFYRVFVGLNGDMVKAINRPRVEFYSAIAGVVVDIVLNAALIPLFGIVGAAFGTIVGYFVYNTIEVVAIYRAVGSYPFSAAAFKPLVPTTLVGVGVLALASQRTLGLFAIAGIGVLLYAAQLVSMILTRSFTETDLQLVEQFEARFDIDLSWLTTLIRSES